MEWKWTEGEPYERSRRIIKSVDVPQNEKFSKELETSAYSSSLHHDENTWDILNQHAALNGFRVSNKREDLDTKIADRDLVQQCGFNPFLSDNNYINDISVRDQFLKPVNTTQGRTKNQEDKESLNNSYN